MGAQLMIEIEKAIFCSGNGQFHTNESDKSNPNKKLLPYKTTTLECIRKFIDKPQKVDKTVAKWVLASSLPSRNFKAQENNGKFWMLWADLDNDTKPIHTVEECLIKIIGNCQYEIYTSKSATEIKQKARILIFLDTCLNGKDWKICQEILNDKLNKSGLTPDRANERTAQLCFLPNKGIFYDSKSNREEGLFDPMKWFYKEVGQKKLAIGCAEKEAKARREQAVKRRAELKYTGGQTSNLIGAFNKAYAVEDILIQAGYKQRGNTFCHPNSSSGSYAASIKNERVNSLNGTDPLNAGEGGHDSFSAFCVLFHEGDIKKAIINAAHQWLKIDGESWNKVKQREFMRKNDNALGQQEKIKSPKQIVINSPATNGVSIGCDATADNSTSGYQTVFSDDSESYYSSLDSRMFEGRPPNVDGVIFDEKKPAEIKTKVPPVPALSVDLIPEPYRAWLADVSYRIQTPPDFSTVSAFVVTGSIIGSGCSIKPKQKDDWDVVPNIWGVCIGRPSILLKTPSMDEVTKLLDKDRA